jgi:hypothetical protein
MAIIEKLIVMQKDCAKLEYYDNDQASRRLKQDFIDLRKNELEKFHRHILSVRDEVIDKYNQSKKRKNHEQQSEEL